MAHVLAKELRDAVLQAAIQGKLTKQLKDDTPVEEILKSIEEQKRTLIKKNKLKKKKPFHLISNDEIPFDIPDNWVFAKLGYISTYDEAKQKINARDANDNLWMLDLEDIAKGGTLLCKKRVFERKAIGDKTVFEKGSILYSKLRPYLLKILIADEDGICTPELVPFKMYGEINTSYIALFLKSPYVDSEINKVTYGVKMPRVGTKTMVNFYVPLPPIEEQQRIVDRVDELMAKIDEYEKLENQLVQLKEQFPKDMRDSLLQAAIQGKLTEQNQSDYSANTDYKRIKESHSSIKPCKSEIDYTSMDLNLPENWVMAELNELFDFVDYRGKTPHKINEGVFLITASNVRKGFMDYTRKEYISEQEYQDRQSRGITEYGDLVFTTEAPMGMAALCDLKKVSCGQRVITLKEYIKGSLIPKLFMLFILSPSFQQQLQDNCTGTTAKGIKGDKLKHFLIPLPPIEEQQRIVDKLDEMLPLVDALAQMD